MSVDIHELKRLNPIEVVIQEKGKFTLKGGGRYLNDTHHDSFVVDVEKQYYVYNSKGRGGSVLDYLMYEEGMDMRGAIEFLCRRAGVEMAMSPAQVAAVEVRRERESVITIVADYFAKTLASSTTAAEYCAGRGWTQETIEAERLGYWDGNHVAFKKELDLHEVPHDHPVAVAVLGYKGDVSKWANKWDLNVNAGWLQKGQVWGMFREMLVYTNWSGGACTYFSGRAVDPGEKRYKHWKPPVELLGEQQVFWNSAVSFRSNFVVLVEGQADGVTLGQWGLPCVALGGVATVAGFGKRLTEFKTLFIGLDGDEAGVKALRDDSAVGQLVAERSPDTVRVVRWAEKDANDWLKAGATAKDAEYLLGESPNLALWVAEQASKTKGLDAELAIEKAVGVVAQLPEYAYAKLKSKVAKALGLTQSQLGGMVKAVQKQDEKKVGAGSRHKPTEQMAGGYIEDTLFEMIYDPTDGYYGSTAFAVRDPKSGKISIKRSVEFEDLIVVPFPAQDDYIRKQGVILPSGVEDYGDQKQLLGAMQSYFHKFVDVPVFYERLAVFYALMTWMIDLFPTAPYLRSLGQFGSGKSRYIEFVSYMSYRCMRTIGASSSASIFRTLDMFGIVTLCIDEADFKHSDKDNDMIQIINTGNRPGFPIWRVESTNDGRMVPKAYETFGPKMVSQREGFKDAATNSRFLTCEMNSLHPDPRIPIDYDRDAIMAETELFRNMLLKYRMDHWRENIEVDYSSGDPNVPGRLRQITIPLKTIAPELSNELDEFVAEVSRQMTVEWRGRYEAKVLEAIVRCYYRPNEEGQEYDGGLALQLKLVAQRANHLIDSENSLGNEDEGTKRYNDGKKTTAKKIGWVVRTLLNLKTERGNVGKQPTVVVWDEKRIRALCIRYGLVTGLDEMQKLPSWREKAAAMQAELDL